MQLRSQTFSFMRGPAREGEGAGAGAGAAAAAGAGAAGAGAAAGAAAAATPWHQGVEPEVLGHWQNKGWKVEDPKEIALAATKQARELEKHFGVPADQLIKMPKVGAAPEDIKAFRIRLGMPAEAKDYDFSAVKDMPPALADTLRASAHANGLTKEAAAAVAADVQKALDGTKAAETAVDTAKAAEELTKLKASWGANFDLNYLKAREGAKRLGITPEAVKALEKTVGYASVMESMRKVGNVGSEDVFIERGSGGSGSPATREGAIARKAELMADKAWGARLLAGEATATSEWRALNQQIDGETV